MGDLAKMDGIKPNIRSLFKCVNKLAHFGKKPPLQRECVTGGWPEISPRPPTSPLVYGSFSDRMTRLDDLVWCFFSKTYSIQQENVRDNQRRRAATESGR